MQQALLPGSVAGFDTHGGIQREASAVVPARHVHRIGLFEMAIAGEPGQYALAYLLLHCHEIFRCQLGLFGKVDLLLSRRRQTPRRSHRRHAADLAKIA